MDEFERRMQVGTYLQLSLLNRTNPATPPGSVEAIDAYVREWLNERERVVLDGLVTR